MLEFEDKYILPEYRTSPENYTKLRELQEALDRFKSNPQNSDEKEKLQELIDPEVLERLAFFAESLNLVPQEIREKALRSRDYQTFQTLMDMPEIVGPVARERMKEAYGFDEADFEGFDQTMTARTFMLLLPSQRGSFRDEYIATIFRNKRIQLDGKSPLEAIRSGDFDRVYEVFSQSLFQQA